MAAIGTTSYADLDQLLTKLNAKMKAWEVHALYLGGLSSTSFRLGPQRMLDQILGDEPVMGESLDEANAVLQVIFGYWNTLVAEREKGRVRLVPLKLSTKPTQAELRAYAARRHRELDCLIHGIDAGGDDPIEFGPLGMKAIEALATASGFLESYIELLDRPSPATPKELAATGRTLKEMVATVENVIADLMEISDGVRKQALETYASNAGRKTDDGVSIGGRTKVGRNEVCPCGSGKKWKKCCGAPGTMM